MAETSKFAQAQAQAEEAVARSESSKPDATQTAQDDATEQTPLLSRGEDNDHDLEDEPTSRPRSPASTSLLRMLGVKQNGSAEHEPTKRKRRWPSIIALLVLCALVVVIIVLGFLVPSAVEEYAMQAMVVDITSVSPSLTSSGLKAHVQGDFSMDARRVKNMNTRNLGRLGTWVAREVESEPTDVEVYLPQYENVLIGSATIPAIKVNIQNRHYNRIDFYADIHPGSMDGVRTILDDWVKGRLHEITARGEAQIPLRSGLLRLGNQSVSRLIKIGGDRLPTVPAYNISKILLHQVPLPSGGQGMRADVSVVVKNDYPFGFTVPPLGFGISVKGCPSTPLIMIGDALTEPIHVEGHKDVTVDVVGTVRRIPDALVQECPQSDKSPLDVFLNSYIHGKENTIFVRGSDSPDADTPRWLTDLLSNVEVPLPFKGRTFEHLLKNFSLAEVHFKLPEPFAEPNTPEASPKISAKVLALVGLPNELNVPVKVDKVKAIADIFYQRKKLGYLDLEKWQDANSTKRMGHDDKPELLVESSIENAPLTITDDDVFSAVVQKLIWGKDRVMLHVEARVDVEMKTALGTFAIRKIPAQGVVPVKPIRRGGGFGEFKPQVGNLRILDTTDSSLTLEADVNFTNPTAYSASVPFVDINILTNNTILAHATAENLHVGPGNNTNLKIKATWNPSKDSGAKGLLVGRELISQYLSGYNTTLTLKTWEGTIPAQPVLGRVLSGLEVEFPTPRLGGKKPGDGKGDGDDRPHFIEDATMHLFSSTALFHLRSPLTTTTLSITSIDATARYHGDEVGRIIYDLPFDVPPGVSETPRLPVDWDLGSVGYQTIRKALGGELKLNASAIVDIKIGRYEQNVWFTGRGIGAKIRL